MIYRAIHQWYMSSSGIRQRMPAIVLHTSCVNYPTEHLRKLSLLPIPWLLPDNVVWELRLLRSSKTYGQRAELILNHARQSKFRLLPRHRGQWDLEQLYRDCQYPIHPEQVYSGPVVFAFGDLNKMDEFMQHAVDAPNFYILINGGWHPVQNQAAVFPLSKAAGRQMRRSTPLSAGASIGPLAALPSILCSSRSRPLQAALFQPTGNSGSYARIYTCTVFPDLYVKVYKERAMSGSFARKLDRLTELASIASDLPLALPRELLREENGGIIGFTMRRCEGKPLRNLICNGWDGHDPTAVFRNLTLLLLELHCRHIIVNDLSFNNIMVDSSDNVFLVDCDSFQIFDYPGGGITDIYRHPDIGCAYCHAVLRQPRHEYFAFAVLLFQCLFYDDPLRQIQQADDDRTLNWNNAAFPLDIWGKYGSNANRSLLELWEQQDLQIRKLFADTFHFRSDCSFGAWIRAMDLLA